jgi:pSer/pThr/pTyr-binding forkhead associated (FHA) protein
VPPVQHRADRAGTSRERRCSRPAPADRDEQLAKARGLIERPGEYLFYEEGDELHTVALTREWTRIGRSLAADVRFDDPTVSRRHALIVRQPDGVRLLDDRSLNGVFVNGARVDGKALSDGDEIIVGRYRLSLREHPRRRTSALARARPARVRAQPQLSSGLTAAHRGAPAPRCA